MTAHKTKKKREKKEATKKPIWKRQAEKKKKKNKSLLTKVVVFGIIFLMVGLVLLFVYRMFNSGTWKGRQRYNLLVGEPDKTHALVSVSADESDVLIFVFHPDFMIEGIYGYGDYKIGSLMRLGKLEKLGDKLIKKSVQNTMGIRVHGYINSEVPSNLDTNANAWLKKLVRPMTLSLIGNEIGVLDIGKYSQQISGLREDQIEVVVLHESRLAFTVIQPDETEIYQMDELRLDGFLQSRIKGLVYSEENHGVSVVNTTPHSGLATSFSRVLLNAGLDVVGVGENQMNLEKTQVLVKDKEVENSETVEYITCLLDVYEMKSGDTDEYRADVVVLVGEDYYESVSKKQDQ